MTRVLVLTAFISGFCLVASASDAVLNDWCVNSNSDINTACNGAGSGGVSPLGGTIDLSAFDTTLSPGTNNLGTITDTLSAGLDQSVLVYMDYDVDFAAYGSFQDSGSTSGTLPADVSYELDDPNTSNIFSDFAGDTLMDTNNVGTASSPPAVCCDVSWALGLSNIDVAAGDTEDVSFTVSSTAPTSGFYLQQVNLDTGDAIYLSVSESCDGPNCPGGSPVVPEPRQEALLVGILSLIFIAAWKRKQQAL